MSTPEPPTYDYDVFISYSHKDEDWVVKELLPRLEGAGAKVCIDFRDFTPGKAALHNMRDAVERSARTLLVVTPNWVASHLADYEGVLVRSDDPTGRKRRTIPLLLQAADIPKDISILSYIDFTRPERLDLAWRQLLAALADDDNSSEPFVFFLDPGAASSDDIRAVLRALNELHIAAGGLGFNFVMEGDHVLVTEVVPA
jgi:hypothetical protein